MAEIGMLEITILSGGKSVKITSKCKCYDNMNIKFTVSV